MCIGGSAAPFPPDSMNASTSCLRTRPPRPVPSTCSRSIPCSEAIRITTGEYLRPPSLRVETVVSPLSSPASPEDSFATSASLVPPDDESLSLRCASPGFASVAIRARTVPTSTVIPTSTRTSWTRPVAGASTSVSILSVEIAAMISSACTQSPTCFFHSTTVPSATETPICGICTSTVDASVLEELTARLLDVVDLGQHGLLERRRERDRHVRRGDADDRPVEVLPGSLGDQRGDLG